MLSYIILYFVLTAVIEEFDHSRPQKIQKLNVTEVKLNSLKDWKFNNKEIFHKSKRFFKIIGVRIKSNFYKKNWDQPIISQNEIGILGIIKNSKTKKVVSYQLFKS